MFEIFSILFWLHTEISAKIKEEQTVQTATELIISFEGFEPCPYFDSGGWSIGYGSLARSTDCISESQARKIVEKEVRRLRDLIFSGERFAADIRYEPGEYSANEAAAMISFAYNTPVTMPILNDESCTISFWRKNKWHISSHCLYSYVQEGTLYEPGLIKRREKELSVFFGDEQKK